MKHPSQEEPVQFLLTITAVVEAATGAALLAVPALLVGLLFGGTLDTTGLAVGRVTGAALVALGVACWCARRDENSRATIGILTAMLFYNLAVAAILAYAGLGQGVAGILLWPVVILHAALAGWCIACLRPQNRSTTEGI
jgi:hypothetical protein